MTHSCPQCGLACDCECVLLSHCYHCQIDDEQDGYLDWDEEGDA